MPQISAAQKEAVVNEFITDMRERYEKAEGKKLAKGNYERLFEKLQSELLTFTPGQLSALKYVFRPTGKEYAMENMLFLLSRRSKFAPSYICRLEKDPTLVRGLFDNNAHTGIKRMRDKKGIVTAIAFADEKQFDYLFGERPGGDDKLKQAMIEIGRVIKRDGAITETQFLEEHKKTLRKKDFVEESNLKLRVVKLKNRLFHEKILKRVDVQKAVTGDTVCAKPEVQAKRIRNLSK